MIALLLVGGLLVLVAGAEILVRGAARFASSLGISRLIVGLTVVAFGTSAPELAVSIVSAVKGQTEIAVGNVVGSNIANIAAILGLSALASPLAVRRRVVRVEVPLMIAASALMWLVAMNRFISRVEGVGLFLGFLCYIAFQARAARKEQWRLREAGKRPSSPAPEHKRFFMHPITNLVMAAAGLVLLTAGSHWFVRGAVELALVLGVDKVVVGLTVVALGTSLPELATSLVAALRGERDVAVGNVVGSNVFNILSVLGLAALAAPAGGLPVTEGLLHADIPFMFALAVICLPVVFTGGGVSRWEGGILVFSYVAYIGFLVLSATAPRAVSDYEAVLLFLVGPVIVVALAVSLLREVAGILSRRGLRPVPRPLPHREDHSRDG